MSGASGCRSLVASKVAWALLVMMVSVSGSALARGDAAAGRARTGGCAGCHGGVTGVSPTDVWPTLAGQKYGYLVSQLRAFREGTRKSQLMEAAAKLLTDSDIEDLSAYFSTIQPGGSQSVSSATAPTGVPAVVPHAPIAAADLIVPRAHVSKKYWEDKLPAGEGRSIAVQKCQLCHELQRAIAFARPRDQWQQVVQSMSMRGSPVYPEEIPVLVDYFTRNFGLDSKPIPEVGMKPCKPSEWPRGSSEFRSNWRSPYNIWVSNQMGGNIDIVDPQTQRIVRRINCVSAPDRIEFSRDGNTAYAPDRVEHNITVIDTRTGAIEAKVPLIARPNTATLSRDYKKLYAGIWPVRGDEDKHGYVQVFDTTSWKIVKTIATQGGIHDTWVSPDGKLLLAMSPMGQFMNAYDTRTDRLLYTCCTEAEIGTMNLEAAPDGSTSRIFFSYSGFYGVVVADPNTGKELMRVPHPVGPSGPGPEAGGRGFGFHGAEISPDGKNYWVISQRGVVYRYELPSFKSLGEVPLSPVDQVGNPFTPNGEGTWLTVSPDGKKVYAVRPGRNLLSVIDVASMKEEALIPTGEYPLHISIWPRGTP